MSCFVMGSESKKGNPNPLNKAYSICCKKGKVMIEKPPATPKPLLDLFLNDDGKSQNFRNNIRTYNSMFAFTSMGGKKLLLQNLRRYIYDTYNEIKNRARAFSNSLGSSGHSNLKHPIDRDIMNEVKDVLDTSSDLVKTFRRARDRYNEDNKQNIRIKLVAKQGRDVRTYNLPTSNEVADLIVGDFDTFIEQRDIVIEKHHEGLERINIFHPLYLPLQYPLLMPCGQDGTVVFPSSEQLKLRCDTYLNIRSSIAAGNTDPTIIGKPVMLSSSFTGGPRYMRQNYIDAMALCRWYGYRPDVLSRVFKIKLDQLMKDVKELRLFGRVQAAEIPNPNDDLDLYKSVLDFMMHGPCGEDDPSQACMVHRKCSKHFPKKVMQHSSVDSEGYPVYRRRYNRKYVEKSGHHLHNGFVILYNATLLKRYQCHINVEWCNQTGSIKYLFKYINKGPDRVSVELYEPATMVQQVLYDENSDLEIVLHKPSVGHSMFEGWKRMNELYPTARELTYAEFLTKYVWNAPKRIWTLRKQGKSIGRIHNVPISIGDAFYCRMLLNNAKGCRMHDEIKKVNGVVYPTYKEACYPTSLLEDDKEYIECIKDAAHWATVKHLCELFVTLLSQKEDLFMETLAAGIRRKGDIVLNVASNGIASLLMLGGQTAHSRFHIPINIDEASTFSICPQSDLGALLKKFKLIIWDEALMTNKLCFEALDRTLRDVLRRTRYDTCEMPFVNMTMVFGGDFRQVLLVIPKGSRQYIVNTSLKQFEDEEFGEANDGDVSIDVPEELLIDAVEDLVTSIIDFTYPSLLNYINNPSYFQEKAIVDPTNEMVDTINDHLLNKFPKEEMVYLSYDSIDKTERGFAIDEAIFSPEFIYGLKFSGVQNHRLTLKVGVPIMLLQNIDQANGLYNGTRLQVLRLTRTYIQKKIINGTHFGKEVIISRLRSTPSDKCLSIKIVRKQYPLSLLFAMTINKSQGQSISKVSLYLPRPVFTHGQLYVALSRVKSKRGLKAMVCDEEGNVSKTTTNVVYKEVLHGL
nr:hypothetical protein [Tanacetum cinerariifolium]